jgi:hypothetical protein
MALTPHQVLRNHRRGALQMKAHDSIALYPDRAGKAVVKGYLWQSLWTPRLSEEISSRVAECTRLILV